MSGKVNYNVQLDTAAADATNMRDTLDRMASSIEGLSGSIDNRLTSYYSGNIITPIESCGDKIANSVTQMQGFGEWLNTTMALADSIDQQNLASVSGAGGASVSGDVGSTSTGSGSAGAVSAATVGAAVGSVAIGASDNPNLNNSDLNNNLGTTTPGEGGDASLSNTDINNNLGTTTTGEGSAGTVNSGSLNNEVGVIEAGIGGASAASAAAMSDVMTMGSATITDAGDTEFINPEEWDKLPKEMQDTIINKLKEAGYSDEEIEKIIRGEIGVSKVVVNKLNEALEQTIKDHPELREELVKLYGFDAFNPDGTVNKQAVIEMLLIDIKNPDDNYDLIELLHSKYGIDLVNPKDYTRISQALTDALAKDPNLRKYLMDKYGIDIFNPDGTINRSKLVMAMLIDQYSDGDAYDIEAYLKQLYGQNNLDKLRATVLGRGSGNKLITNASENINLPGLIGILATGGAMAAGGVAARKASASSHGMIGNSSNSKIDIFYMTKDAWDKLSKEEQDAIIQRLREVGYTDEEIKKIIAGDIGIPKVIVEKVGNTLQSHPELRQEIIGIYGFDVFASDGNVILAIVLVILLIDNKNQDDSFDIIAYLHEKYGIDLVSESDYERIIQLLKETYKKDKNIREYIKERYGIDAFNNHGTIDRAGVVMIMIIDEFSSKDSYDIEKTIKEFNEKKDTKDNSVIDDIMDTIDEQANNKKQKKSSEEALTIGKKDQKRDGWLMALAGVAGLGAGKELYDKEKEKQKEEKEEENLTSQIQDFINEG